jgi:hypothetical protein
MNYKIVKLDRRYAYHLQFPYMIEFHKGTDWAIGVGSGSGVLAFDRVRKWMNESWGWSQDIETRAEILKTHKRMPPSSDMWTHINMRWAYSCRYQEYRIYVDESALTLFKLKWSQDATT